MLEPVLSVLAIVLILYLARLGMLFGLLQELGSMLWLFFAMMVALRYWWLATGLLVENTPMTGAYAALVAFWSIFLIACVPLLVMTQYTEKNDGWGIPEYSTRFWAPSSGPLRRQFWFAA